MTGGEGADAEGMTYSFSKAILHFGGALDAVDADGGNTIVDTSSVSAPVSRFLISPIIHSIPSIVPLNGSSNSLKNVEKSPDDSNDLTCPSNLTIKPVISAHRLSIGFVISLYFLCHCSNQCRTSIERCNVSSIPRLSVFIGDNIPFDLSNLVSISSL